MAKTEGTMEIGITKTVKPWKTPKFVVVEGGRNGIPIGEIPEVELLKLANDWKNRLMADAGYPQSTQRGD